MCQSFSNFVLILIFEEGRGVCIFLDDKGKEEGERDTGGGEGEMVWKGGEGWGGMVGRWGGMVGRVGRGKGGEGEGWGKTCFFM